MSLTGGKPLNKGTRLSWKGPAHRVFEFSALFLILIFFWQACASASAEVVERMGSRILKQGSKGSDVAALQEALRDLGFNPGPVDGWFGSLTLRAVMEFQRRSGLPPDGLVGPMTREALRRALESREGADVSPGPSSYVVKAGDTLWAISRNAGVSIDQIMRVNGLSSPVIYPGQRLVLSPRLSGGVWVFAPRYRQDDLLALESVRDNLDYIDVVVDCSFSFRSDGTLAGTGSPELVSLVKGKGKLVLALVTNTAGSAHDRAIATAVLTSAGVRKRALSSVSQLLNAGYDGICLDLENVSPSHRSQMSTFVRDLSMHLGQASLLAVAVPAKTKENTAHGWSGAFDYADIGRWSDAVVVMAYDQHYRDSAPGPVASLSWVQQVLSYAVSCVPATKLVLGIPSYGYEWPLPSGRGRSIPAFRAQEILTEMGVDLSRDEGDVPYFRYAAADGERVVYYEDGASLRRKMGLASDAGLSGVAMWRAGYETEDTWESIRWYTENRRTGTSR